MKVGVTGKNLNDLMNNGELTNINLIIRIDFCNVTFQFSFCQAILYSTWSEKLNPWIAIPKQADLFIVCKLD